MLPPQNDGTQESILAIKRGDFYWRALRVRLKGEDIYVHPLTKDGRRRKVHTSYHASGEWHPKISRKYVEWDAGPSDQWEAIRKARPRATTVQYRERVSTFGLALSEIANVLHPARSEAKMIVDASEFEAQSILAFEVSIVGEMAEPRTDILGFPIIQRCRLTNGPITVEIEVFRITEELASIPS